MATSVDKSWLESFSGQLVFLLDADTVIERQLLERYVQENCQYSQTRIVHLSLRSGKYTDQNSKAISEVLKTGEKMFFLPLRVAWGVKNLSGQKKTPFRDLLFGVGSSPGIFRQKLLMKEYFSKRDERHLEILVAKGASYEEIEKRYLGKPRDVDMPWYIARLAFLALERSERTLKGARYKVPRLIDDEVLGDPQLKNTLQQLSETTGKDIESLEKYAASCLKEMAATPTKEGLDLTAELGRYMYTRGFDEQLEYLSSDLDRIRRLLEERPVAFVFTHKSQIDGFLLYTLFHDLNLPPVHTFGGINMGFFGLGTLLRKAGAIFIRRSFSDDEVYKAVFKNYIDYLGKKRFPLMWSLEGTRSRTGKLMPPRYGILNYVISAYLKDDDPELVIMPVSIVYDQIPEVGDYDYLQAGGTKRPESALWFLQYLKGLKNPYGKIHIRFGEGLSISNYVESNDKSMFIGRRNMQKLAFDLAVDVNNATPITLNSLICYVLLEQGHRAISFSQLTTELNRLLDFIAIYQFPMTEKASDITPEALHLALNQLSVTGVISITKDAMEVLYMIPHGGARIAAYYRNGLIQFFITGAVGELALMAVKSTGEEAMEEFHKEALRIRDLMKYEFFFEGSEAFLALLERQFDLRQPGWRETVMAGRAEIRNMLQNMDILIGHGTLRPFLEAYLVFAKTLSLIPGDKKVNEKILMKQSLALGKQGVLQQRIHCEESVSQSYFENAVKIAEGKNLLEGNGCEAARVQLHSELQELAANCRFLASINDAKRYEEMSVQSL